MRQFFKIMFASALGAFVAMGALLFIVISVLIGLAAGVGSTPVYKPSSNAVFKIRLDGTLSDNPTENPIAVLMGETDNLVSLKDMLEAIQIAKDDDHFVGIYLEAGSLSSGSASLEAIRRALEDFKESGKFVVAYADTYTQGNYFLCSVADKVFLNPQGVLELVGLASQTVFYKGLLEKIGVETQVFKVGTYKGAIEPLMLDKLSEANREQIDSYVSSAWTNITRGIAWSRGITVDVIHRFANEGFTYAEPEKAVEMGFIDALKYKPEAEEYVKDLAGQSCKKLETANIAQMKTLKPLSIKHASKIAVLYAEGEIQEESAASFYDTEAYISEKLANELIKLKNDADVKAVVLRVNSPGGSSYVSDQIWREVVELRKEKPIVVSMGDVAASGGYYISCAANKIIAEANTLTGSIGIFGIFPNVAGLLGKVGLTTDVVKTNTYADIGDMSRPMTESEKRLLQGYVDRGYQTFLSRCAEGRDMTTDQIDQIGQGRVWTGEQAKELGLVDELGGLERAIQMAAGLADLSDYEVKTVKTAKDFWDDLFDTPWSNVKSVVRRVVLRNALGEEFEHFQTLQRIKTTQGIQARLPFDIRVL